MKAVYDKNGLLTNVYYPVPGKPGSYQLSNPIINSEAKTDNKDSNNYSYKDSILTFKNSKVTNKVLVIITLIANNII